VAAMTDDRTRESALAGLRTRFGVDRHLVIYALIGLSSVVVDVGLFTLGHRLLALTPLLANMVSVNIAIGWSFGLNTWLNFGVSDRLARRFVSFYTVSLGGLVLSSLAIAVLIHLLAVQADIAKIVTLPFVVGLQYVLNRRFSFGAPGSQK